VPCEPLDTPKDWPEQARRQVALGELLGELQDEVPGMRTQALARLASSLLRARQGLTTGTNASLRQELAEA
jgi:hypothetical protein